MAKSTATSCRSGASGRSSRVIRRWPGLFSRRSLSVSARPSCAADAYRVARPYDRGMCRNIHTLFNFEPPATEDEVRDAALQYVRKISGFTKPSRANAEVFDRAIDAVAAVSLELLGELSTTAPPKDREVEAAKARAR